MTIKTPEQVAREHIAAWDEAHINPDERRPPERTHMDDEDLVTWMTAAIEADRAQRSEPVDPDWQDDADMYRDAAAVDISWRAWDANGRQIGYSDAGINGAQAAAMFEAIGRTP